MTSAVGEIECVGGHESCIRMNADIDYVQEKQIYHARSFLNARAFDLLFKFIQE